MKYLAFHMILSSFLVWFSLRISIFGIFFLFSISSAYLSSSSFYFCFSQIVIEMRLSRFVTLCAWCKSRFLPHFSMEAFRFFWYAFYAKLFVSRILFSKQFFLLLLENVVICVSATIFRLNDIRSHRRNVRIRHFIDPEYELDASVKHRNENEKRLLNLD